MADRYSTENLNRTLTQFALETMQQPVEGFIAEKIAPIIRVPRNSGTYYKFEKKANIKDDFDTLRAPKDEANEVSRAYTEGTFACQQHALKELIADEERRDVDLAMIDPDRDAQALITDKLRLGLELRVNARVMSTTYVTETGAATAAWNAASGVKIEDDIDAAKNNVLKKCGRQANVIVIPPHIATFAKKDSEIHNLCKYTRQDLLVNGDLPPRIFNLEVLIPTAIYDEAAPGLTTQTLDFIWDDNSVLVAYVDRSTTPNKRAMSLAYQFRCPIGGAFDIAIKKYRKEGKSSDVIEGQVEQCEEVVCVGAGYLISGAYA